MKSIKKFEIFKILRINLQKELQILIHRQRNFHPMVLKFSNLKCFSNTND